MSRNLSIVAVMAVLFACCGCTSLSPYDYAENWLIRENDIPKYYSTFDLFYIGKVPADYGDTHEIQFNWTKTHTNDIFGRGVRVFAPNFHKLEVQYVRDALQYYLEHFHTEGHPFVLLAEGKDADLLYEAMQEVSGLTAQNGFVAAYLPDMFPKTVNEIAEDFYWDDLKAASGADDYGVIVTWTCRINGEKPDDPEALNNAYLINPLNWKTNDAPASSKDNIKAVFYMPRHKNIYWRKVEEPNFCGAVIDPKLGVLNVNCPTPLLHNINGKYTNNCISIFAGNIADNARKRTRALIQARQWSK